MKKIATVTVEKEVLVPMTPEQFCQKWGAKEITTDKMRSIGSRRFLMPDGKTKFGYTCDWLVYTKGGSGTFKFRKADNEELIREEARAAAQKNGSWNSKAYMEVKLAYMLSSLDSKPLPSMEA